MPKSVITERDSEDSEVIRHSCAHLMAQAVQRLFPSAQVTIGPVIEDGFFYDFAFERAFTPEDLEAIENMMGEIVKEGLDVHRSVMSRSEAITMFREMGEEYKVEIIPSIPGDEDLSFYKQGDFIDLCRGPHVPNTSKFKAFKLTSVAGAYWRGDSNNAMLQRIYGTAWATPKDLKQYLRIEEAEKRDHHKLGKQLNLFHFQKKRRTGVLASQRVGCSIKLCSNICTRFRTTMAIKINTQLVARSLGAFGSATSVFKDEMFSVESESRMYAIKPMNACHIQVFNQGLKSYRDLPILACEFGSCHRYEPSGSMHMDRCACGPLYYRRWSYFLLQREQIQGEVAKFMDLLFSVYRDFWFR